MKFDTAWDSLEKENRNLKILTIILCTLAIFLTVTVTSALTKDPLIIERACYSKMLEKAPSAAPTDEEIKAFLEKALAARFDSQSREQSLISVKQRAFREKEQSELVKQKMTQRVIINEIKIGKDSIFIEADRVISVQNLRTVLRFPLKVTLESVGRSEGNPYGLILSEINSSLEEAKE